MGAYANQSIGVSLYGASADDLKWHGIWLESGTNNDGLAAATVAANTAPAGNGVGAQTLTIAGNSGSATVSISANDQATAVSAQVTRTDLTALSAAINDATGKTEVTALLMGDKSEIMLRNSEGKDITLQDFINSSAGTIDVQSSSSTSMLETLTSGGADSTRVAGGVLLSSDQGFTAVSNVGNDAISLGTTVTASSSAPLSGVDISIADNASGTILIVDDALAQINRMRGTLGAVQNRFLNTISSLQTTSENLSAACSRIRDSDFAAETTALTRAQILRQAGVAMLAQANTLPNNVLTPLR